MYSASVLIIILVVIGILLTASCLSLISRKDYSVLSSSADGVEVPLLATVSTRRMVVSRLGVVSSPVTSGKPCFPHCCSDTV